MESGSENSNEGEEEEKCQQNYNNGYLDVQFTKELIQLYKKHTCLWKPGIKKDRTKMATAYKELVKKYREVYPQADVTTVKMRLESMKSAYRKCLRRVLETYESAKNGGDLHVPKLWYFKHLLFLHEYRYPELPTLFGEAVTECEDGEDNYTYMNESYSVKSMPRKMIEELLLEYKNQECLWKPDMIMNKEAKIEAYNKLTEICRKYNPDAHHAFVRNIINSCRSTYRREKRKILNTVTHNEDGEVVSTYVPKLWYFHLLSFLNEELFEYVPSTAEEETSIKQEPVPRKRKRPKSKRLSPNVTKRENLDCGDEGDYNGDYADDFADFTHVNVSDDDRPADEENTLETTPSHSGDLFESIGHTVAHKMRLLPRMQRIIAERLIHEVLYNAELERLDASSALLVADPHDKLAL